MFSNFTPDEILEAPVFDCLFEYLFSNSSAELENSDSTSFCASAIDFFSTVAVDTWHVIRGRCFLEKLSEFVKDFVDENGVKRGCKVLKNEERRLVVVVVTSMFRCRETERK